MTELKLTVEEAIEKRDRIKKKIRNNIKVLNSACMTVNAKEYADNKDDYDAIVGNIKSKYQSLSTMVLNYDILSSAIMQSNHSTTLPGIKNYKGKDITIAEAISILNSPTGELVDIIRRSKQHAYDIKSKSSSVILLDVLGKDADKYIENYEQFSERLRAAIRESNRKNKITVNLQD